MDDDEQHKDVFAHFGLALYFAQVLEHGLVNALVVVDHLPKELRRRTSQEAWEEGVDAFMDKHFLNPMGRLIRRLEGVWKAPDGIEEVLHQALERRNWLAHDYFRERATDWFSADGRKRMIDELVSCQELFRNADKALEQAIQPLRDRYGITEEAIQAAWTELLTASSG